MFLPRTGTNAGGPRSGLGTIKDVFPVFRSLPVLCSACRCNPKCHGRERSCPLLGGIPCARLENPLQVRLEQPPSREPGALNRKGLVPFLMPSKSLPQSTMLLTSRNHQCPPLDQQKSPRELTHFPVAVGKSRLDGKACWQCGAFPRISSHC